MSEVTGLSVAACVSDWLDATADGAEITIRAMERAKADPARAMAELQMLSEQTEMATREAKDRVAAYMRSGGVGGTADAQRPSGGRRP